MSEKSGAPVADGSKKRKDPPIIPLTSDDDELPHESGVAGGRLSWRMEPQESHSDWTIEILTVVAGKTAHSTYHVHKNILSVGPRRSGYFARLFSNKNLKEHETQTSRIALQELAAAAFPVMLDYLYSLWDDDENHPPIKHESAVALHHLGGYFEVRGLRKKARAFWKKEMKTERLAAYLEPAKLFHDEKAYQAVVKKCCSFFPYYDDLVDPRLMEVSDAQFWLDVLKQSHQEGNTQRTPALSNLVSTFCSTQKERLDADTFLKLTNEEVLPKLSANAAIELLELEKFFVPAAIGSAHELSNLQERSIEALTLLRESLPTQFAALGCRFRNLTPLVLSKLLVQASEDTAVKKDKLDGLEYYLPYEVEVSGAGSFNVDGTYTRTGKYYAGVPRYAREGVWNNDEVIFDMFFSGTTRKWCISILAGSEPSRRAHDFYCASQSSNAESVPVPPSTGWVAIGCGINPAPMMECNYHCCF